MAAIYAYRSQPYEVFGWLNKAVTENDPALSEIATDPLFANPYEGPGWLPFLERIDRSPEQLSVIEFEVRPSN
jgi:hypothetical protein